MTGDAEINTTIEGSGDHVSYIWHDSIARALSISERRGTPETRHECCLKQNSILLYIPMFQFNTVVSSNLESIHFMKRSDFLR